MVLVEHGSTFVIALFVGILAAMELGRRLGKRQLASPDGGPAGFGAVEGAVFGLLGLLLAFTFSGAAARFDDRRHLIREEANAIGTAWLRLDVLPAEARARLQQSFRLYLDSRISTYKQADRLERAMAEYARSTALQGEIWSQAGAGCRQADASPGACVLLLPALNEMIDITTTRLAAGRLHPPDAIFALLAGLALAAALMGGHATAAKARSWMHALGFAIAMALTIYVIFDLEFPRRGYIRVDEADALMIELRQGMGEGPRP